MSRNVCLCILAPLAASTTSNLSSGTCSSKATDCSGNDLYSVTAYSVDDCCAACQKDVACGAGVFVQGGQWGNTCYIKSSCAPAGGCAGDSCTTVMPGPAPTPSPSPGQWYEGIEGIQVLSPGDSPKGGWWDFYLSMRQAQFSDKRHAILLTSGEYPDAEIGVGFYTSIIGVGASRDDVRVKSFYSLDLNDDGSGGGATQNFWRSVEGVTAITSGEVTWATSQACPLRRSMVSGELKLSETGAGTHWSSGGFMSDMEVRGVLECGTQQQFFFRNSRFQGGVQCSGLVNGAFVGTVGEGNQPSQNSRISSTPEVAEKPFLVEHLGQWHIAVPRVKTASSDRGEDSDVSQIVFDEVFVARAAHSSQDINAGIQGKMALLLTPGVYDLDHPISISKDGFVVLGLGFPTLVSRNGNSALVVEASASNVRVAHVLFEAGSTNSQATHPMLLWQGSHGIGSDIFSRVGAFPGRGCAVTRADVHVQVIGSHTILDNTWLWHADHDECGGASDQSFDKHGLQVDGTAVTVYGLKVEHTFDNLVQWNAEDGSVFFYQSELPYHQMSFGSSGHVGYYVAPSVTRHQAHALGVYIVGNDEQQVTAFRLPHGLDVENMVAWCITGSASQFAHLVCLGSDCYTGDCDSDYKKCRMGSLPSSVILA